MSQITETLHNNKQQHLSPFLDNASLSEQLASLDWQELNAAIEQCITQGGHSAIPEEFEPAPYFPLEPQGDEQKELYAKAFAYGNELITEGKVAAFTVAGGQGTRLGFNGPKGTLPVSLVKDKSLFQLFAEQLLGYSQRNNAVIPWYIMCSPLNHDATKAFFVEHNFFGLNKQDVKFFIQGVMPATDFNGNLLRASEDSLAFSPNGHGGSFKALIDSGSISDMLNRGIEHLSYFQVDNPMLNILDPLFVGLHALQNSDMSSRSLSKTGPYEKLGNFVLSEGKMQIIEYSDFPNDRAVEVDEFGKLRFLAGSPAIHMVRRDFLEKFDKAGLKFPFHRAEKKVPCLDENGVLIKPEEPNAVKFETFVFDALPMANNPMVFEASRKDFSPVKNKTGVDSHESCRAAMNERSIQWLTAAGVEVPEGVIVELSPRSFMSADDVLKRKEEFGSLEASQKYYFD